MQPNIPKEIEPNKSHNETENIYLMISLKENMLTLMIKKEILSRSNYFVKDINSDIQGESLLKGINHINTYILS